MQNNTTEIQEPHVLDLSLVGKKKLNENTSPALTSKDLLLSSKTCQQSPKSTSKKLTTEEASGDDSKSVSLSESGSSNLVTDKNNICSVKDEKVESVSNMSQDSFCGIQNKLEEDLKNKTIQNKKSEIQHVLLDNENDSFSTDRNETGQFVSETLEEDISITNNESSQTVSEILNDNTALDNDISVSKSSNQAVSLTKNELNQSIPKIINKGDFFPQNDSEHLFQEHENDLLTKSDSSQPVPKTDQGIVFPAKNKHHADVKNTKNNTSLTTYEHLVPQGKKLCVTPTKTNHSVTNNSKDNPTVNKANDETVKETVGKKKEYQFHMQPEHTVDGKQGKKQYKCDICAGIYRHAFSLKRHFLRNHINYKYLSDSDIANCNINVNSLKEDQKTSAGKSVNQKIETLGARSEENKESVVSTSEDMVGLYRCHLCRQLFDTRGDLKSHVTNHPAVPSQKSFSCPDCDMTFTHKQNLVRHSSVHAEVKVFECSFCFKKFRTAEKLQKHETLHKGGKTVICNYCNGLFALEKSLKKHIMKFHKEHIFSCDKCPRNFTTKVSLEKHQSVKHNANISVEQPLKICNEEVAEGGEKRNSRIYSEGNIESLLVNASMAGIQVSCTVCKKQFSSYVNMCRHRRLAHQYIPRGKQGKNKYGKPIVQNSSALQDSSCALSEAEFFLTIAEKISENLIHFVDGKSSQIHDGTKKSPSKYKMAVKNKVLWTNYNFPSGFDFSRNEEVPEEIDKSQPRRTEPEILPEECNILKAIGLKQECDEYGEGNEISGMDNFSEESGPMSDEELVMNKSKTQEITESSVKSTVMEGNITYICKTCGERFASLKIIEDHKLNNHPNVFCTHIEVEGEKEIPPEICYHLCSPVGKLRSCVVPPLTSTDNSKLHCTKCQGTFDSVPDLHLHILECGGDKSFIRYSQKINKLYKNKIRKRRKYGKGIQTYLDEYLCTSSYQKKPKKIEKSKKPMWELRYTKKSSQHMKTISSDQNDIFTCDGCDIKFNYFAAFQRHKRGCPLKIALEVNSTDSNLSLTNTKTLSQRHSCRRCGRRFTYLARLKKHIKNKCYGKKKQESVTEVSKKTSENVIVNKTEKSTASVLLEECDQIASEDNNTADTECKINQEVNELKHKVTELSTTKEDPGVDLVVFESDSRQEKCLDFVQPETDILKTSIAQNIDSIPLLSTCENIRKSSRRCKKPGPLEQPKISPRRIKAKKIEQEQSDPSTLQNSETRDLSESLDTSNKDTNPKNILGNVDKSQEKELVSESSCVNCDTFTSENLNSTDQETFTEKSMEDSVPSFNEKTDSEKLDNNNTALEVSLKTESPSLPSLNPPPPVILHSTPKLYLPIKPASATSINQTHKCSVCRRTFSYLANYRKHIRDVCPAAKEVEEKKDVNLLNLQGKKETEFGSGVSPSTLSVRGQIQNSVLGILRAQTKQQEMMNISKEEQKSATSPRFHTFSCNICHKIFFSFLKLLQHSMSHKLSVEAEEDNNGLPKNLQDNLISSLHDSDQKTENSSQIDCSKISDLSNSIDKDSRSQVESVNGEMSPGTSSDIVSQENVHDVQNPTVVDTATSENTNSLSTASCEPLEVKAENSGEGSLKRISPGRPPGSKKNKGKTVASTSKRKFSLRKDDKQEETASVQESSLTGPSSSKRLRKSVRNK
ncbi:uncharacterized protein LOC106461082 [Limulus polyphemus]|uniref:Uncharacterized protein LOC106461082 n=1 Tax=Limulus polyphemus TaxID=6850 RepID=A0ABM1SJ36_LIMPO|nr:uncharacterized protein LOC106461082 [Limulus polyphemus]XP_022243641.1 uncharacterized protein LOC106461082 [Limulus polyphemus]XP_022243642.1 uncharacterized protein LOC106461082 [Limulus polyphemus]